MELVVQPDGSVHCVYAERIDLSTLGSVSISRASHVEPDDNGCWHADLSPVGGPLLGPFPRRSQALAAEVDWLRQCWLPAQGPA